MVDFFYPTVVCQKNMGRKVYQGTGPFYHREYYNCRDFLNHSITKYVYIMYIVTIGVGI